MTRDDVPGAERTIGSLLALMSHDLRNPLSVLLTNVGYLESVLAQGDVAEAREVLGDLAIACDTLAKYVSNLDTLAASLGRRALLPGRASVVDVVRSAVLAAKLPFQQQRLEADVLIAEGCADLFVDAELAARAIESLLSNAATFAPEGSVVSIHAAMLPLERVRITVSDAGVPLPPEHRRLAFTEAGQEALQRDASSRYGRGLGLLVVGVVARRLGGSIDAPPRATGCKFELELPSAPPDSAPDSAGERQMDPRTLSS